MKFFIYIFAIFFSVNFAFGGEMKIEFICENATATAVLNDTNSARSLYEILPLELDFKDYAGREKIAYLPSKLNYATDPSSDGKVGEIAYFSPWGNLVLFYKPQPYYDGLIKIGKFESGFEKIINCEKILVQKVE